MKKKQKNDDWDDGSVIAPMTGEELPGYRRGFFSSRGKRDKSGKSDITKKEERKMILAMFAVMLPRLLIVVAGFALAALVVFLWLC